MDVDSNTPHLLTATEAIINAVESIARLPIISNEPWTEKYRPHTFSEVISQQNIVQTLDKFVVADNVPHLLLYGPPGTGKTTTALALARKLNGEHYAHLTLELNASDDRTIGIVREQIKTFVASKPLLPPSAAQSGRSYLKIVILDEADALTADAQAALRRIIEQYTHTTRFCLICNHAGKIVPAIQSRCTRFRFPPLQSAAIKQRLQHIVTCEHINLETHALRALIKLGNGDMRRYINVLQAAHLAYSPRAITENDIYGVVGLPTPSDVQQCLSHLLQDEYRTCYDAVHTCKLNNSYALSDLLSEFHHVLTFLDLSDAAHMYLNKQFAEIEVALANGASDAVQLGALVAAFVKSREQLVASTT